MEKEDVSKTGETSKIYENFINFESKNKEKFWIVPYKQIQPLNGEDEL